MSDLPKNVIPIRTIKIIRDKQKYCECYEPGTWPRKPPRFELDKNNREVICKHCGNIVDAFDAITIMADRWEDVSEETERVLRQAKEIENYKPWLRVIKQFEHSIQHGKMIPVCPHCDQGILLEELVRYRSKEFELKIRANATDKR